MKEYKKRIGDIEGDVKRELNYAHNKLDYNTGVSYGTNAQMLAGSLSKDSFRGIVCPDFQFDFNKKINELKARYGLLLSLGDAGIFVLLYIHSIWSAQGLKETYRSELNSALKQGREMRLAGVSLPPWRRKVEYTSYVCVLLSLLLLGVSSFLCS